MSSAHVRSNSSAGWRACETCAYFRTNVEFKPTLQRQRDHARERGQKDRAELFDGLLRQVEGLSS